MSFLFSPPDQSLIGSTVTGTVDADFFADWLTDGRPGYPVKATGTLSLAIAASPAVSVGIVAAINHNLDSGNTVDLTGDVTATITAPAARRHAIPRNPYALVAPAVPVSALTVAVTGNSVPVVLGEFWGGTLYTLEWPLLTEPDYDPGEPFEWEASLPPYDDGQEVRRLAGETYLSDVGLADVEGWWESTRRGTQPSLIVPDSLVNDAWLVTMRYSVQSIWLHDTDPTQSLHHVQFEFVELPRTRW